MVFSSTRVVEGVFHVRERVFCAVEKGENSMELMKKRREQEKRPKTYNYCSEHSAFATTNDKKPEDTDLTSSSE